MTDQNKQTTLKKIALVTGAASGIGAAVVRQFIGSEQFRVIAVDRNRSGLEALQAELGPAGNDDLTNYTIDLADFSSLNTVLRPAIEALPHVDVVIAGHGIADENQIAQHEIWDKVMAVNLTSTQRLMAVVDSRLRDNGRVVVISSVLGRAGKSANTAYCASKHALLGLAKGLALDWAPRGITVNAILPCWVDTPMLRAESKPQADALGISIDQMMRRLKKRIPLRKLVADTDVADCIAFLVSPQASMITAQSIVIDGGFGCGL